MQVWMAKVKVTSLDHQGLSAAYHSQHTVKYSILHVNPGVCILKQWFFTVLTAGLCLQGVMVGMGQKDSYVGEEATGFRKMRMGRVRKARHISTNFQYIHTPSQMICSLDPCA